tara:strand:+ start:83 stop:331 length:249 start_codon:yes stop_codon:yes gene_type:complete
MREISKTLKTIADMEEACHEMWSNISEREGKIRFVFQYMLSRLNTSDQQYVLNYLIENQVSQDEISDFFGVHQSTISRWARR